MNTLFKDTDDAIKSAIAQYCQAMKQTIIDFDDTLRVACQQFLDALAQSDHSVGRLVIAGYELCDGKDPEMILVAARAIQMTHVYAVMSNDSEQERLGAMHGMHVAQILLANLQAPDELRLKALSITNRSLLLYMHAQASSDQNSQTSLQNYATELFLNPLHVGMVLAGADCAATDAITAFALDAGKANLTKGQIARDYYKQASRELKNCTYWSQSELSVMQAFLPA